MLWTVTSESQKQKWSRWYATISQPQSLCSLDSTLLWFWEFSSPPSMCYLLRVFSAHPKLLLLFPVSSLDSSELNLNVVVEDHCVCVTVAELQAKCGLLLSINVIRSFFVWQCFDFQKLWLFSKRQANFLTGIARHDTFLMALVLIVVQNTCWLVNFYKCEESFREVQYSTEYCRYCVC